MKGFFKHTYYNTYYYANIVNNVLSGDLELMGFINNFFVDQDSLFHLAKPFEKKSALHQFIESVVADFFMEDMHQYDEKNCSNWAFYKSGRIVPYAEQVLLNFGVSGYNLDDDISDYSTIEEYHDMLTESGILWELFETIAKEVFYLLFNNRQILLRFNSYVARYMCEIDFENSGDEFDEVKLLFTKSKTLKRVRVPEWARKAVFYRDRGKCCSCFKDLSGILSISNSKHFDHIIPLALMGLNDVVNIQLLCEPCNLKKGKGEIETSEYYEGWY